MGSVPRVVYKFTCADYNACYVGKTVQHFSTGVKEHLARASHIFQIYKVLNIVALCVEQIVFMF